MNALTDASEIEVELEYANDQPSLLVHDNGCGISCDVLNSPRNGHWGFSRMRERTGRIGAKLRVLTRAEAGTEIELTVHGHIAYLSHDDGRPLGWVSRFQSRMAKETESAFQIERAS